MQWGQRHIQSRNIFHAVTMPPLMPLSMPLPLPENT